MNRVKFSHGAKDDAGARQGSMRGRVCARYGEYQWGTEGEDWGYLEREPVTKTGANCVIVCAKCARELRQDGSKTIPLSDLPYYHGRK